MSRSAHATPVWTYYPQNLEEACNPKHLAVIVYDMQVGIVQQLADGRQVATRIAAVLDAARASNVRVIFTRHMSLPNELAGVAQLRTAMAWQHVLSVQEVQPTFLRDTPPFEIIPELKPLPNEAIFDKITLSAFEGTPLNITLRDCGIDTFAIVGIATEVGIEPTVRHAMDLAYLPIIITDACGSGDRDSGERSLASLAFTGGSLQTNSASFIAALKSQAAH